MRRFLANVHQMLQACGWRPKDTLAGLRALPGFIRCLRSFRAMAAPSGIRFQWGTLHPCLHDANAASGSARGQYFHQDLLVARRVFEEAPQMHCDAGSRIDGFVAHVAVFRPITVLDIRPARSTVHNIHFIQADLMADLPAALEGCCDSLSCLHALEHFGLGRYGDRLDPDGYLAGLQNLHRLLQPHGRLYLSVPIGPQRVEFNGHRVFAVASVLAMVAGMFELRRFSFVDDAGDMHEDQLLDEAALASNCGCQGGCGIFEFQKA